MSLITYSSGSIAQLRTAFFHLLADAEALARINGGTCSHKQKQQALKSLMSLTPPCWVEPEFFLAGAGTVTLKRFVFANHNVTLLAQSSIEIGEGVFIGPNAIISTYPLKVNGLSSAKAGKITIGDAAWIGANAIILPGVRIGRNAIVGAGALVLDDVPDNTVVTGKPAKIRRPVSA